MVLHRPVETTRVTGHLKRIHSPHRDPCAPTGSQSSLFPQLFHAPFAPQLLCIPPLPQVSSECTLAIRIHCKLLLTMSKYNATISHELDADPSSPLPSPPPILCALRDLCAESPLPVYPEPRGEPAPRLTAHFP